MEEAGEENANEMRTIEFHGAGTLKCHLDGIYIFTACFFMLLPIVVWLMSLFRHALHAHDRQASCER